MAEYLKQGGEKVRQNERKKEKREDEFEYISVLVRVNGVKIYSTK